MEAESFGCERQYLAPQATFTYFVTVSVLNHRINSIISLLSFLQTTVQYLPRKQSYKVEFLLSSTAAQFNKAALSLSQ